MFNQALIIPTGDELAAQIVLDTDSPLVMGKLLALNGTAAVTRVAPIVDKEAAITEAIKERAREGYDLIIIIGGSGGGHRYSPTLGKDFTHTSLESILTGIQAGALYGKNGHMWSKLVMGRYEQALVFNVPGPYEEVQVTMDAFVKTYAMDEQDLKQMNEAMLAALQAKYGA